LIVERLLVESAGPTLPGKPEGSPHVPFELTSSAADGTALVAMSGELDMTESEFVRAHLEDVLSVPGIYKLHVDLSGLTFLDSRGLAALVGAWNFARDVGLDFEVGPADGTVERVLTITGMRRAFDGDHLSR
jgi:anti-anti-sigma factor